MQHLFSRQPRHFQQLLAVIHHTSRYFIFELIVIVHHSVSAALNCLRLFSSILQISGTANVMTFVSESLLFTDSSLSALSDFLVYSRLCPAFADSSGTVRFSVNTVPLLLPQQRSGQSLQLLLKHPFSYSSL